MSFSQSTTFGVAGKMCRVTRIAACVSVVAAGLFVVITRPAGASPESLGGSGRAGSPLTVSRPRTVVPGPWSIVPSPDSSSYDALDADSCVSESFCMAVGPQLQNGGGGQPALIERWNGSTWSVVPGGNIPTTNQTYLAAVSCVVTTFCVAVGGTEPIGGPLGIQSVIEVWNGSTWSWSATSAVGTGLSGVSCPRVKFCMAVGESTSGPVALEWNGITWSTISTPSVFGTHLGLSSVTCKSASAPSPDPSLPNYPYWCVAVGSMYQVNDVNASQTLIERWNGSAWSIVSSPNRPGAVYSYLWSVSCPSPWFCVTVGDSNDASNAHYTALIEQWDGASWLIVPSPVSSDPNGDSLSSVSCVGTTSCVAVGAAGSGVPPSTTEIAAWNGLRWAIQSTPNPPVVPVGSDNAVLLGVSCVGGESCFAVGYGKTVASTSQTLIESAAIHRPGYRLFAADGGVFAFGGATYYGSAATIHINRPIVGMAVTPDGGGYWMAGSDGGVFAFNDAGFFGSTGNISLNKPIVGMASTPDGAGYWLVASDGGVFAFGDAGFFGSTGNISLNKPIVGMAATPSGQGYWLVASDGGVFAFGDAGFYGSMGAVPLNRPMVGMAAYPPSGLGYWLAGGDGGVYAFGVAGFFGSTGSLVLNKAVVGMAATPSGQGYWLVASDGGVFAFGDAGFYGSTGGLTLNSPIVGIAA